MVAPPGTAVSAHRVLVVEDDPSVRGLLDTLLTAEGYQVATASDGLAGLRPGGVAAPGRWCCST